MAGGDRKNPKRAKSSDSTYSIMEFMARFPDDDACLNYLWRTRYAMEGDEAHAHCPKCGEVREFKRYAYKNQRQAWACVACGQYIYPTAGTVFEKSSTALHLWFYAIYLMASTRCGISAKQLERELGVTYKTAYRIFKRIREQLMTETVPRMRGPVEMDETFYGGKTRQSERRRHSVLSRSATDRSASREWAWDKQVPVWGVVERGGNVAARVVESTRYGSLAPHINAHVVPGATVYTDKATTYRNMDKHGFEHQSVDHGSRVYVSGDIHTQTIEGFWSLVKRGISGTNHAVSPQYLQGYVDAYAFRYNHRNDARAMFELLLFRSAYPA